MDNKRNKIIFLVEKNSKNLKNSDSISEDDMKENEKILTKKVIREKEKFIKKHPYKKRKSKLELSGKNYLCESCYKCYLSYAACYMHMIKKHKMTPIELKSKISKRKNLTSAEIIESLKSGYSYKNFEEFTESFKKAYQNVFLMNIHNYSTFLINSYTSYENHPLFNRIKQLNCIFEHGNESPVNHIKNIDDSLAIFYLGNWNFRSSSERVILIINILLFREGANFLGWEYIEIYKKFFIMPKLNITGEYCLLFMPDDVPQITDDYLSGYLNFDSNFPIKRIQVALFIIDFCNFLFEIDVTNYKVEPIMNNF